ncbi:MAG: hypothetical protein WBQ45_20355 [Roseiarcus sp.]
MTHDISRTTEIPNIRIKRGRIKRAKIQYGLEPLIVSGAAIGCHNATGVQWKCLRATIKGLKAPPNFTLGVYVNLLNKDGSKGEEIGTADRITIDDEGNSKADFPGPAVPPAATPTDFKVDAGADFSITILRNPAGPPDEQDITVVVEPTDENGFPIS